MKTKHDPRHIRRVKTIQSLFSFAFAPNTKLSNEKANLVTQQLSVIDQTISKSAPVFPIERIARVDLAILRLAVYELLVERRNPPKVIIDEAVELAKEFGGENASSFINGVLGDIWKRKSLN